MANSPPDSAPARAVFLSYASEDADAARRIADTLRAADIEVWFDQSELVGGDAWDQKIRKQIKDCALFMPVIGARISPSPLAPRFLKATSRSPLDPASKGAFASCVPARV